MKEKIKWGPILSSKRNPKIGYRYPVISQIALDRSNARLKLELENMSLETKKRLCEDIRRIGEKVEASKLRRIEKIKTIEANPSRYRIRKIK